MAKNIQVIKAQEGPQWKLLCCPAAQILFGGGRGGGKSYGLLLDWLAHAERWKADAKGIIFRRTYDELEDLIEKSDRIFPLFGAKWKDSKKTWYFKNGARLKMRYLDRDKDVERYQGHEYTWMGFDELGNWPSPAPIDKLYACLRSAKVPPDALRWVASCNPGGPGHNWIKKRFVDPAPPMTIHYARQEFEGQSMTISRCFLPSLYQDNKALVEQDPTYIIRITAGLPEYLKQAWANGNWDITAGGMFDDIWDKDIHVVQPFEIPPGWMVNRAFDWGSAKPFSVGWWAQSNGEEFKRADGSTWCVPPGTLFRISEWYGCSEFEGDTGLMMAPSAVAEGIIDRQRSGHLADLAIEPGPADSSIYAKPTGIGKDEKSIAEKMEAAGVYWEKCDKGPGSRINGWALMREMMENSVKHPLEKPGLYIFDTCRSWISIVPLMQRDQKNPDDIDTNTEDHIADETRYRIMKKQHGTFSGSLN